MPLPGPPNLGLLAFKLFASDLAADQAGEAQEGFVDAAVPLSHCPPDLFLLPAALYVPGRTGFST